MKEHKAVLIKDGERTHQYVGTRQAGAYYPYVMFAGNLYVRWEQGDEHDKGRVPAYMHAEYYEGG